MSVAEPGTMLFDRYRVVRRIAAGGMGTVFEARDLVLDQPVALKRVSYAALPDELAAETRERTLREARNAAQMRGDQHIVAIYDVQVSDDDVWLVLEYLPSRSLAELTAGRTRLDVRTVAGIGATVARALAAAHARGITHRDVKPGNILIATDGGAAKLTDFGISHAEGESTLTATGQVSGTPAYMAREVARGEDATPASDVFSLAATLYAAVEGTGPFGSQSNPRAMVYRVAHDPVRPPEVSGPLAPVLMAMLADEPSERPVAATVAGWLDALAGRPGNGPLPPGAPGSGSPGPGSPLGGTPGAWRPPGPSGGGSWDDRVPAGPSRPGSSPPGSALPGAASHGPRGNGSPAHGSAAAAFGPAAAGSGSGGGAGPGGRPGPPGSGPRQAGPPTPHPSLAGGQPAAAPSGRSAGSGPAAPAAAPGSAPASAPASAPPSGAATGRRRPVVLAAGALVAVLVVVAVVLGVNALGSGDEPAPASPRAISGDPRAADPCALLDLAALQRFGTVAPSAGAGPAGCRADVTASDGRPAQVTASFSRGVAVEGGPEQVGDLVVVRGRTGAGEGDAARPCEHSIGLPDGNQVLLRAYSFTSGVPPCDLADQALDSAVGALQRDGVRYDPNRNSGAVLAGADACQSLDAAALGRAGIGAAAFPGFASWSCSWGSAQNYASVSFDGTTERTGVAGTPGPPVLDRKSFVVAGPGSCAVTVAHREGAGPDDRMETVTTTVRSDAADPERACAVATDLATTAETRLPA